ncbi:hypothetical protein R1flu_019964 [Riccia fluitans]|uniref:RING-type E3 ubiquitin transferase n=1 Tax=Riccia fluitans TaxID=41844 RepID=A0ABD1ZLS9_9MARC
MAEFQEGFQIRSSRVRRNSCSSYGELILRSDLYAVQEIQLGKRGWTLAKHVNCNNTDKLVFDCSLAMEEGISERPSVQDLLQTIRELNVLSKDVTVFRSKCELLVSSLGVLETFLSEIESSETRISDTIRSALDGLKSALERATRALKNVRLKSKFKRLFLKKQLAGDLSSSTADILRWINKLPWGQFKTSLWREEEIGQLRLKIQRLEDPSPSHTSQDDDDEDGLAAELKEVIRAYEEAQKSTEGDTVLGSLLECLAKRLDSDVNTVIREWQEVRDEALLLRQEMQMTAEKKREMEQEILEQISGYLDNCINIQSEAAAPTFPVDPPDDFCCGICLHIMQDPVVCASEQSFCRACITKWFRINAGNETCPVTMTKVPPNLIGVSALRNLIRRWQTTVTEQHPEDIEEPGEISTGLSESVEQAVNEGRTLSLSGPGSRSTGSTRPSVGRLISSLDSASSSAEVRVILRRLSSIAQQSSGKWEIYSAKGVPIIARLLRSENSDVVEKAADVLENITFQRTGDNSDPLPDVDREELLACVCDNALDSLINGMHKGNSNTRLAAARTVVCLLENDGTREAVRRCDGVVKGLLWLANISSGVVRESKEFSLCITGLGFLADEEALCRAFSHTDQALTAAMVRLAVGPTASPKLVQETIEALRYVVEMLSPRVPGTLLDKKSLTSLVHMLRWPKSPSERSPRSYPQPKVLTEVSKNELLIILDLLSKGEEGLETAHFESFMQLLVECGLSTHLLPRITDPEASGGFVSRAITLLRRCILGSKEYPPVHYHIDFQTEMKGLVNILRGDLIQADAKHGLLEVLVFLCERRRAGPLRETFLKTGGVEALGVLGTSELREGVTRMLRLLAESHPRHKDLRTSETVKLLMNLLEDEVPLPCPNCRCQAVAALAAVIKSDDWDPSFEGLPSKQVVDMLSHKSDCRKAATSVLAKACQNGNLDLDLICNEKTIKVLLGIVRDTQDGYDAAELLINLVVWNHAVCSHLEGEDALSLLTYFRYDHGGRLTGKVMQLLLVFAKESDSTRKELMKIDGVGLLVDAIDKGRSQRESYCTNVAAVASMALKFLVKNYAPARKAVIEAELAEKTILCLLSKTSHSVRTLRRELIELLDSLLEEDTAAKIIEAEGVQALVGVLSLHDADMEEKKLVAVALRKLIETDERARFTLGRENGMKLLNDLLKEQANAPIDSGGGTEALETLIAAIEDKENLQLLLKEQCIEPVLLVWERESTNPEVERLALDFLLKLSRELAYLIWRRLQDRVRADFLVEKLSGMVLEVIETSSVDSSVENAVGIIRNISFLGPGERKVMLSQGGHAGGVVNVIVNRIRRGELETPSHEVNLSIIALEKFMDEKEGRESLLKAGGFTLLVKFLNNKCSNDAQFYAVKMLKMLVSRLNQADVCPEISRCQNDLFLGLRDILDLRRRDQCRADETDLVNFPPSCCKAEAADLIKELIIKGPRVEVCKSIRFNNTNHKLGDLQISGSKCAENARQALAAFKRFGEDRNVFPQFWR